MRIFPAIDLYEKKAVRLFKGNYAEVTVYSNDPVSVARDFKNKGAEYIHLVDLEGAKDGTTPNIDVVASIVKETGLFAEIGGGIRSMDVLDAYFNIGVSRAILGTAAVSDEAFLRAAITKYGDKIAVGADVNNLSDAKRGEILNHTSHADKAQKALAELIRLYAAARQMRERNIVSLHLTGNAKQTALGVGGAHTVHVILIVKRRPKKNGLAQSLCNIGRGLLISEVGVDHKHRVNLLLTEAGDGGGGRVIVKDQIITTKTASVHEGNVTALKIFLNILHETVTALFGGNPSQESLCRAIGGITPHRQKSYFYVVIQHNFFSFSYALGRNLSTIRQL